MSIVTQSPAKDIVFCPIVPLHDNVVIKTKKADTETKSGIVLIESAIQKIQQGIIVGLADNQVLSKLTIGDEILMAEHAGIRIEINKEVFIVLSYEEILGILKGDK